MLKTKLNDMIGTRYPIIQAGMGPWKTDRLAMAAANAGALGIITLGSSEIFPLVMSDILAPETGMAPIPEPPGAIKVEGTPTERVKKVIQMVKEATRATKGIFGVNCMVSVELREMSGTAIKATIEAREEDPEVKERLRVIITSAGDPLPWTELIKPSGLKWFHVVPSVRHAKRAEKAGVDVVIASGQEGGGHCAWEPVHSIVLTPAIVKAVNVPVISAGGFCDGASLVAALALGAIGVQMGTRFIATQESGFIEIWKNRILESGERDTLYARGAVGPIRCLKNKASLDLGALTLKKAPRLYLGEPDEFLDPEIGDFEARGFEKQFGDDVAQALFFGGEAAGRIDDIPTVSDLVARIGKEAEEILSSLPRFIEPKK